MRRSVLRSSSFMRIPHVAGSMAGIYLPIGTLTSRSMQASTIADHRLRATIAVAFLTSVFASARAQEPPPSTTLEALHLDTTHVGRITAYFGPADREYAHQLATLSDAAAAYFEREFGGTLSLHLAILSPEDWFDPYTGGDSMAYGMPWGWVEGQIMAVPASLDDGVLILGPDSESNRRRVQFVMLHELGHIASKRMLHPESPIAYSSVWWFEEFLATYFAYSFVRAHDTEWAEASRKEWVDFLDGYTPAVLSMDWDFMDDLPPEDFARTYAWYQMLLNLWAAELYEDHSLDFLRNVRDRLPWREGGAWTSDLVLRELEEIAPGFQARVDKLQSGGYLQDRRSIDHGH